jgi:hypothetical protein
MNKIMIAIYTSILLMAVGLVIGASGIISEIFHASYIGAVLIFIGIVTFLAINTQYLVIFIKVKKRSDKTEEPKQ